MVLSLFSFSGLLGGTNQRRIVTSCQMTWNKNAFAENQTDWTICKSLAIICQWATSVKWATFRPVCYFLPLLFLRVLKRGSVMASGWTIGVVMLKVQTFQLSSFEGWSSYMSLFTKETKGGWSCQYRNTLLRWHWDLENMHSCPSAAQELLTGEAATVIDQIKARPVLSPWYFVQIQKEVHFVSRRATSFTAVPITHPLSSLWALFTIVLPSFPCACLCTYLHSKLAFKLNCSLVRKTQWGFLQFQIT